MTDTVASAVAAVAPSRSEQLAALIESDPRLKAIENPRFQKHMALALFMGDSWEDGLREFQGMLKDTASVTKEFMETTKRQREESEKAFIDSVVPFILTATKASPLTPKGDITIRVEWDKEFKNSDGSPMLDPQSNPIRGTFINVSPFNWEGKRVAASTNGAVAGTSTGRVPGDFIFGDETFTNMSDYAKKYLADEFAAKGTKTTRQFLSDLGYEIPESPTTDDDGKPHFIVTLPTAKAAA